MRILILANLDVGLYKFRKELIEELLRNNHEVVLSLPDGDLVRPFEIMGCKFINTPVDRRGINPITDLKLLKKYKNIFKEVNPDLVITYTIKPNIYGGLIARHYKTDYAVNITGLGSAFEKSCVLRKIVTILYKVALRKVKVVFVENQAIANTIKSFRLCDSDRITVLNGAGVNTEEFAYEEYPDNEIMQFLFVGRVMREKGIDELLQAMRRLNKEGSKCCLNVVGPFEENYQDSVTKFEDEGWLNYYGYQEDVKPFIKACDCFVLPSYHEGMANTNLECASSGRPIITSNIPGCREAVIDGKTGFLCEPKNSESLYKKMKLMLSLSSKDRRQMGFDGRQHMQKIFDKSAIVEKTITGLFGG